MIYSLRGPLLEKGEGFAAIECHGVGFICKVSNNTLSYLPKEGEEVFLYTYMALREDACDLFGFYKKEELASFKLLTTVNGVGPKMAMAILSSLTVDMINASISQGDAKTLTQAPGVGKKLASRIILELKDKVSSMGQEVRDGGMNEGALPLDNAFSKEASAKEALIALGYPSSAASAAIAKCSPDLSVEDMIKQALKALSRQ